MTDVIDRILYVVNSRMPTEKAQGYQVCQMAQAFMENGVETTVLCPRRFSAVNLSGESLEEFYSLRRRLSLQRVATVDLMPVVNHSPLLNRSRRLKGMSASIQTLAFAIFCRNHLLRKQGSIIYLRDSKLAHLLRLVLPAALRDTMVLEVHRLSSHRLGSALELETFRKIRGIVTVTGQIRQRLIQSGVPGDAVLAAHDGVDLDNFDLDLDRIEARDRLGWSRGRIVATYVGNFHTMDREKGIPDVIRASKLLVDRFPELDFHFVGGPLDRVPAYRDLLCREGIPADRFTFLDKQPVSRIPIFLRASDILLMPFPWTEHYAYYMSPLKLFEYMSASRPIVASSLPTVMEVLEDGRNAVLCEPGGATSLARCIERVLQNDAFARRIGDQARRDVERYTWKERARKILEFLARERIVRAS